MHERPVHAGGVHDRAQLVDPLVQAGDLQRPVRQPRTPLVEDHLARERGVPLQHPADDRGLPGQLHVLRHGWHDADGRGAVAEHLVGQGGAGRLGEADLRHLLHAPTDNHTGASRRRRGTSGRRLRGPRRRTAGGSRCPAAGPPTPPG
ncbi:hypothetical protein [Ornithinimicrobium kibberense]|uniref:hypothetical protein n=1 Tax=Ornithinimicrobium kibberense TaxID=282060 RepID=UPI00360870D5